MQIYFLTLIDYEENILEELTRSVAEGKTKKKEIVTFLAESLS